MESGRTGRARRRHGSGTILFAVAALLVVMAVLAMSMSARSRGVTAMSQKAIYNEKCAEFAEMAITEAAHYLRIHANDRDHAAYQLFRAQDRGATLQIIPDDLVHTYREVQRIPGYSLGYGVKIEVVRRAAIGIQREERVPYEAVGVVRFSTTVSGPKSSGVDRTDEYGFRSVLTAPPRPLDMCTFFLRNPDALLRKGAFDGDANRTIEEFAKSLRVRKKSLADMIPIFQQMASLGMPGDVQGLIQRLQSTIASWPAQDWQVFRTDQANTTGKPAQLHLFDNPVIFFSAEEQIDLAKLDLPTLITQPVSSILQRDQQIEGIVRELQALAQAQSASDINRAIAATDRVRDLIAQNAAEIEKVMVAYKEFQDLLIEVAGQARDELEKRVRRLEAEEQPWKAHYRFIGEGGAKQAAAFLDRDPPPSGTMYVQDPTEALVVNVRNLKGRLSIVCMGDMTIQNATVQNPDEDLLILTGYGRLEVEGPIQAAIVSWNGGYGSRGESFAGSLILDEIPAGTATDAVLKGTLTRQKSVLSGEPGNSTRPPPFEWCLHIALDPVAPYRRVDL